MSVLLTQTILSEVAYRCVHVMLTTQFEVKIFLKPENGCVPSTIPEFFFCLILFLSLKMNPHAHAVYRQRGTQ